jgi:hypothetical protein
MAEGVEYVQGSNDVECDIISLKTRNWKLKARSRLEWRAVVRKAMSTLTQDCSAGDDNEDEQ